MRAVMHNVSANNVIEYAVWEVGVAPTLAAGAGHSEPPIPAQRNGPHGGHGLCQDASGYLSAYRLTVGGQ